MSNEEPMPPEARKLARVAIATVLAYKMLDREDIAGCIGQNDAEALGRHIDFVATILANLAAKLLEKSGL